MTQRPLREVGLAFAAITLGTLVLVQGARLLRAEGYTHLLVGALFFWAGVQLSQRQPDGLARYGLRMGGLLEPAEPPPEGALGGLLDLGRALLRASPEAVKELLAGVALACVVLPPFALGFYVYNAPTRPFELRLPEELGSYLMTQLLVVALPEEALFRGYFQGRLSDRFPPQRRFLGAMVSLPALFWQALLFGLIHIAVEPDPARLAVFFPALAFGWLRARRGGIGAAAVFHALCNLGSEVLARSWL